MTVQGTAYDLAFLADVHLDHTLPLSEAYKVAKTFILVRQPKIIVIGGDFLEMGALSHWMLNKSKLMEGRRYSKDITLANYELDDLMNRCPDSEFHYLLGNHEDWLEQYLERHPEMEGEEDGIGGIHLARDLKIKERGINLVALNDVLSIGKMHYIHGWYHNMYHAKKTLQRMGDNVMYGHMHTEQVETMRLRAKNVAYKAMAVGCLCDLNPYYKRNRPSDWIHGMGFVEYRENGTFSAYHINIIDGVLSFGGDTITAPR